MNKKGMAIIALAALVLGGVGTVAYQTKAQNNPATIQAGTTSVTSSVTDVKTAGDTDNIQDDNGAVDKPDTSISKDANEQNEGSAADVTEVEDAN